MAGDFKELVFPPGLWKALKGPGSAGTSLTHVIEHGGTQPQVWGAGEIIRLLPTTP